MVSENCWEFLKCGREPCGENTGELGVCPAALQQEADGINNGQNGGRACWAITGTLCGGVIQGEFANKLGNCHSCTFYKKVISEEGLNFEGSNVILTKIRPEAAHLLS